MREAPRAANQPAASHDFGSPFDESDSRADVHAFKEQLSERIKAIRLHIRDVRFDDRRLEVANKLRTLAANSSLTNTDEFNAKFRAEIGPIAGKEVLPDGVYQLWHRLFNNDAPALAKQNGVPYGTIDEFKQYYNYVADVLSSDALTDAVFLPEITEYLRERNLLDDAAKLGETKLNQTLFWAILLMIVVLLLMFLSLRLFSVDTAELIIQQRTLVEVISLAFLLLTIIILGTGNRLQAEAIGTLLGTIAGYIFGRRMFEGKAEGRKKRASEQSEEN